MTELTLIDNLQLTPVQIAIIQKMAGCNYAPSQIALYLSIDKKLFLEEFENKQSIVRHNYDKGQLQAQFDVESSLLHNASSGNFTAAQIFQKNTAKRQFQNHKMRILNEG